MRSGKPGPENRRPRHLGAKPEDESHRKLPERRRPPLRRCNPVLVCQSQVVLFGRLAQLGERRVRNAEVAGSSPVPSTKQFQQFASTEIISAYLDSPADCGTDPENSPASIPKQMRIPRKKVGIRQERCTMSPQPESGDTGKTELPSLLRRRWDACINAR